MNQNTKNKRLQVYSRTESIPVEVSADFILPDRFPDVKRLLRVRAVPSITSRYLQGGKLDVTGNVHYTVLFSADGESGEELHSVHFDKDFMWSISDIDSSDGMEISITPITTSLNSKLANPRKITLRSNITSNLKMCILESALPKCDGDFKKGDTPSTERLWEECIFKRERSFMAEPLQISEVIESDVHQPQIDTIVDCEASMRFYEVHPIRNGEHLSISLKGEVLVDCLYKAQNEQNTYKSFSRKIPMSTQINGDEFAPFFDSCGDNTLEAYATSVITEVTANASENGYGERRAVDVTVSSDVTIHMIGNETASLCADSYSVDYDIVCIAKELDFESVGKVITSNFSVGESLPREDMRLPENPVLVDQRVELSAPNISVERGRAQLAAEATVFCTFVNTDGEFIPYEFKIPVRFDANVGNITPPIAYNCQLVASDLRVGLGNERVSFDFETSISAEIFKKEHTKTLDVIKISGKKAPSKNAASITLCYPASDDTLWKIAKRYNTTISAIESINPQANRVLLIPN